MEKIIYTLDQYFYNMSNVENFFLIIIYVLFAYWGYKMGKSFQDQGKDPHLFIISLIGLYCLYLFTDFELYNILYNPLSYIYFGFVFVAIRRLFKVIE